MLTYDYIAILCKKGGDDIMTVRVNQKTDKQQVYAVVEQTYPDWNVKSVQRLYYEDFHNV